MGEDDTPGNCQADARSARAGSLARHPIEAFEDPFKILRRETFPGIADRARAGLARALDAYLDPSAGGRRPHGVADEIGDHLGEPVRVGPNGHGLHGEVDGEDEPGVERLRPQPLGRPGDHAAQVEILHFQRGPALLRAGELGEILNEPAQPAHLIGHGREVGGPGGQDTVDHALDIAVDDGQGSAHLVGHLAEQTNPAGLGLGQGLPQGVHIVDQGRYLDLAGAGHRHGIPALGHLPGRRGDRAQWAHQPVCRERAEGGRRDRSDQGADAQSLGDRARHLGAQFAAGTRATTVAGTGAGQAPVKDGWRQLADDEEGRRGAENGDQEMRDDQAHDEPVHDPTSAGVGRNLYPTPRTVPMMRGALASSPSALRMLRIWTSTTRGSP